MMRVALTSYPMLWQRTGGLQVQIAETLGALRAQGVDARMLDSLHDRIEHHDLLHVFGAINGNERIVEAGLDAGVPVVVSPILNPPFTRSDAARARLAALINARMTKWAFRTSYEQIRRAVQAAHAVIALGEPEREVITAGYQVPSDRIHVIPNGISERFFKADPEYFWTQTGLKESFVLHVSSVTPYKNPLASARIAARLGLPLVLVGPTVRRYESYLESCRREAVAGFYYLGSLTPDDKLLASAYAAASVLLLPSDSEVMPLVVLESLAAGTPVVMTSNTSLVLDHNKGTVAALDPGDETAFEDAARRFITHGTSGDVCRNMVAGMTWDSVAEKIQRLYAEVLS